MTEVIAPSHYAADTELLSGKIILITGAGAGLGRATAIAAARSGATVVLAGRTVAKLEATYDQIMTVRGPEPAIYPINLSGATWKDYVDLASTLSDSLSGLDGLVHCAAHLKGFFPMEQIEPADWMENLQVNLTAPWALTRACLPLLKQSERASVVLIGDDASAYYGAYGITKAAQHTMMSIWSSELGDAGNPRMNVLYPGPMRTAIRSLGFPGELIEQAPEPDTAAVPAVLWLLGNDSLEVNGQKVVLA